MAIRRPFLDVSSGPPRPTRPDRAAAARMPLRHRLAPYVAIARPEYWSKNVFMLLGVLLAFFYQGGQVGPAAFGQILWALASTCLLASSNYVLNEILDAATDRHHPVKRARPVVAGRVRVRVAAVEWLLLGALGLAMAAAVNRPSFVAGLALLIMGVIYNVPPIRAKELPYLDVLTEAINNPLRLMLGWFAVNPLEVPPLSLVIAYWMIGAFFMATKRLAEYRALPRDAAPRYRSSFGYYTEQRLMTSMFFYITVFGVFFGIFVVRYHFELILFVPLAAGFICRYLAIGLQANSVAQAPERLYRERGLLAYVIVCAVAFVALMLLQIPILYTWFNIPSSSVPPLWKF
jgi:decaprenyl-phosphate phosphoribosyltransferase